jgi:phospholipid N-methyltransferase
VAASRGTPQGLKRIMTTSTHPSAPAQRNRQGRRTGGAILYIRQYLQSPTQIGAVAPSSDALASRMLETVDFDRSTAIVEFGPGPGNVTSLLLPRLNSGTTFFAIEANGQMCEAFRTKFPGVRLHEGSAADVSSFCELEGLPAAESVDAVVSGLPWASFSEGLQQSILEAVLRVLKPGGQMVTFAYNFGTFLPAGRRFSRTLPKYFSRVDRSRSVLWNVPPAFVYRCIK